MGAAPEGDDDDLAAALAAAEAAEAAEPSDGATAPGAEPVSGESRPSGGGRWQTFVAYVRHKPDPLTSLVFVLPVFLAYSLAVLAIDARVGVDFLSRLVLEQLLRNTPAYVAVHVGVAAVLGAVVWILRRKGKIEPARFLPMLIESAIWALVLGALVFVALARLLPPDAPAAVARGTARAAADVGPSAFARCVLALGAGFYEEVVFRAAVVGTLVWALPKYLSVSLRLSTVIALGVSTVLFVVYAWLVGSAADHTLRAVASNVLLGISLGVAYRFRGFAVAVYAHAFFGLVSVAAWALGAR